MLLYCITLSSSRENQCSAQEVAKSFVGDGHGGIDKVASSWTLRGWSPPWTRATVSLRGLKSPSTWMYDSTTYQNHAKISVSPIAFANSNPIPLFSCNLHALLSAAHILLSCLLEMYCECLNLC